MGLSGEVRPVKRIDQRIMEAEKLGFEKIIISKENKGIKQVDFKIQIVGCSRIEEVLRELFG